MIFVEVPVTDGHHCGARLEPGLRRSLQHRTIICKVRKYRPSNAVDPWCISEARPTPFLRVERVRGIEPPSKAWEAFVLPLNYTRPSDVSIGTME